MRSLSLALLSSLLLPGAAFALPPDEAGRGFVDGANHHLGDTSFVAGFGHAPGVGDGEPQRMKTHLRYVRALLGAATPTHPEFAARRAELLGYLDDYIAKGITPANMDRPWRTPVFVDALGNVCAVGYLIERSAGRELVERIASEHRYDFLEDITMPEVVAWIAESGFTLEELASIQPGYMAPIIETWQIWVPSAASPGDGPWELAIGGVTTRGQWQHGQMQGAWSRSDANGKVIGKGDFERGKGIWTSLDAAGHVIAVGPFAKSNPNGTWRFFHASGQIAAEGALKNGQRQGRWTFYYDSDLRTPIARGSFARGGRVSGTWQHFDARGAPFATTWQGPMIDYGEVLRMRMTPHDGLSHEIAEGNFGGDYQRIDGLELAGTRLYVDDGYDGPIVYDVAGHLLTKAGAAWQQSGCGWDAKTARAARTGDIERVRRLVLAVRRNDQALLPTPGCADNEPLTPEASAQVERMMALSLAVREPTPEFVRQLASPDPIDPIDTSEAEAPAEAPPDPATVAEEAAEAAVQAAYLADLGKIVARSMTWYVEWPHIDGAFARVFATLPGHYAPSSLMAGDSQQVFFNEADPDDGLRVVSALPKAGGAQPTVTFR